MEVTDWTYANEVGNEKTDRRFFVFLSRGRICLFCVSNPFEVCIAQWAFLEGCYGDISDVTAARPNLGFLRKRERRELELGVAFFVCFLFFLPACPGQTIN